MHCPHRIRIALIVINELPIIWFLCSRIRITERLKSGSDRISRCSSCISTFLGALTRMNFFTSSGMGDIVEEEIHRKSISFAENLVPERRTGSQLKRYEGTKEESSRPFASHSYTRGRR